MARFACVDLFAEQCRAPVVLPNYPILDAAGFAADDRGFVALQARAVFFALAFVFRTRA